MSLRIWALLYRVEKTILKNAPAVFVTCVRRSAQLHQRRIRKLGNARLSRPRLCIQRTQFSELVRVSFLYEIKSDQECSDQDHRERANVARLANECTYRCED